MDVLMQWILPILIFLPILGGLVFFAFPMRESLTRYAALGLALVEAALSGLLIYAFVPDTARVQFSQNLAWFPESTGIRFLVGVDGISLILVLLTTLLGPLVLASTWSSVSKSVRQFLALFLILEGAMIGVFVALDVVLFFVFWEFVLIPMYFMIGIWGGASRIYATTKFFIYTSVGSLLMLVALVWLYCESYKVNGVYSASLVDLYKIAAELPLQTQLWLFAAMTLAFAIKVPLFPFHTWLPDAHVEAPTAASVILAGVLLKLGTYGLIRFSIPLFPLASKVAAPYMVGLGVFGIIYGALIAWRQDDVKRIVAYSSVSHLGFVVAGLFALNEAGITGALYQMVNHGVTTGALFLLVGVIYERRHTRQLHAFGGIAKVMPWYATLFFVAVIGSAGVPGTGGFIGEWLVLWGVFKAFSWAAVVAGVGVILGAVYLLKIMKSMFFGPLLHAENAKLVDLSLREGLILGSLSVLVFVFGFASSPLLEHTRETISQIKRYNAEGKAYPLTLANESHDGVMEVGRE